MIAHDRSFLPQFSTGSFSRRTFLLSALLSLTGGGFGAYRYSLANIGPGPCLEPRWLRQAVADPQSAARIGRAYLDEHPEHRQCHALITHIERALKRQDASIFLTADAAQTFRTAQHLVHTEYARDEVVSVAGWVLSETEARLYALAAMIVYQLP